MDKMRDRKVTLDAIAKLKFAGSQLLVTGKRKTKIPVTADEVIVILESLLEHAEKNEAIKSMKDRNLEFRSAEVKR